MAPFGAIQAVALLLQAFLWAGVSGASPKATFLARARLEQTRNHVLLQRRAGNPAPAPAAPTFAVNAPAPASPLGDCSPVCAQAKKMWADAEASQKVALDLEKNHTAARVKAEADVIVEDVKLKVHQQGLKDVQYLESETANYMDGRVQAFSGAVAARHGQVLSGKAQKFEVLKVHQGKLMEGLMKDVVDHGYEVAKQSVAQEAVTAGLNFNSNPKVHAAFKSVKQVGTKWVEAYHETEIAARQGYDAWSGAYHGLSGPWNNVTGTFNSANRAAIAARGLGPDTHWAVEVVRVAGGVAQAAHTESRQGAASADMAFGMAKQSKGVVEGNSGSIVTLKAMLAQAEDQANAASLAR